MIPAQCPACFNVFQTEDRYAGRAVECHQCGTPTLVPRPVSIELPPRLPSGSVENATVRVVSTLFNITLAISLGGAVLTLIGFLILKWLYVI